MLSVLLMLGEDDVMPLADAPALTKALDLVVKERAEQDRQLGPPFLSPLEWASILSEESGEATAEANRLRWNSGPVGSTGYLVALEAFRNELVQTAAVAVAAVAAVSTALDRFWDMCGKANATGVPLSESERADLCDLTLNLAGADSAPWLPGPKGGAE